MPGTCVWDVKRKSLSRSSFALRARAVIVMDAGKKYTDDWAEKQQKKILNVR